MQSNFYFVVAAVNMAIGNEGHFDQYFCAYLFFQGLSLYITTCNVYGRGLYGRKRGGANGLPDRLPPYIEKNGSG